MNITLNFENHKEHVDYCLLIVRSFYSGQLISIDEFKRLESLYNEQTALLNQEKQKLIHWEKLYGKHKKTIEEIEERIKNAKKIEDMNLTLRTFNCLKAVKVNTVDELINHTEHELLTIQNFGRKSLNEIKEKLKEMNLSLLSRKVNI